VQGGGDQVTWYLNASVSGDFEELDRNERYSINTSLVLLSLIAVKIRL